MKPGERGAALLTVLMMVSIVAVMAGGALERLRLSTRLAGNAVTIEQARLAARIGETLATARIDTLLAGNPTRITLAGDWSGRPFGLPLPGGGTAAARVVDGGNCFNLNGLVTRTGPGLYATQLAARDQFARLMQLSGIPATTAANVAAAAADWIDSDQDQQPGGAEDNVYLAQSPGYRTAGTLMADASELRAVSGVTPDLYDRIRPLLCALPLPALTPVNVNTVGLDQAALVAAKYPGTLSVDQARAMILRRPPQGFDDVGVFAAGVGATGAATDTGAGAPFGMKTDWFALQVDVTEPGGATLTEHALLDARRRPTRLVSRYWGEAS